MIFDLGGSYRSLTGHYGGSYQHVGQANAFTINPFALPPTAENQEFLFQFVRVLIERDGYGMTAEEREDLPRCIARPIRTRSAPAAAGDAGAHVQKVLSEPLGGMVAETAAWRGISITKWTLFRSRASRPSILRRWIRPTFSRRCCFTSCTGAGGVICAPAEAATPKFVVFDEAWRFFRHPVTREYIHEGLKTWRKRNAAMLLATQSGDDLARSELLPVIAG